MGPPQPPPPPTLDFAGALRGLLAFSRDIKAEMKAMMKKMEEIENRQFSIELQLIKATHHPSEVASNMDCTVPLDSQVPQAVHPAPSTWAAVAARPKAPKRPATVSATKSFPSQPLETISEELRESGAADLIKKARTQKPLKRLSPAPLAKAPGLSTTSSAKPGKKTGPPGPSGPKATPKAEASTSAKSAASKGPTPGPKKAAPGPVKPSKEASTKPSPSAAPKADKKKGKAKAAPKFRDVAMATPLAPSSGSQRPSTSKEVVPQVVQRLPQVLPDPQQPSTSREVDPQASSGSPQVTFDQNFKFSSSEVTPRPSPQAFQLPQEEEEMEMEAVSAAPAQESSAAASGASSQVPAARGRIPPVIIREDSKWVQVTRSMAQRKLNFSKAKTCVDGIRVQPVTTDDFRGITRLLEEMGVAYHTYTLAEDKTLRVVLRPVPVGVSAAEILEDLKVQGFEPIQVTRMVRGRKAMPLVLVEVPARKKTIFNLKKVCDLVVKVEKQLRSDAAPQCHGCQRFYHCARNCRAQVRCVKCAGYHVTRDCPKEASTPAKCANCSGVHTANYRGCPHFPKGKTNGKARGKSAGKPKTAPAKPGLPKGKTAAEPTPRLTVRQEADLLLTRKQLQHSIASAKDTQSLKKALLAFLSLL